MTSAVAAYLVPNHVDSLVTYMLQGGRNVNLLGT